MHVALFKFFCPAKSSIKTVPARGKGTLRYHNHKNLVGNGGVSKELISPLAKNLTHLNPQSPPILIGEGRVKNFLREGFEVTWKQKERPNCLPLPSRLAEF